MHRWQTDKRLSNAYPSMQYFYCDSTRSQGSNVGASNVMRSHSYQQMSSRPAAGSLLLALAFICVCISPTACQPQTPPDTRINRRVDSPAGSSIDTAGDIGRLLASADALALLQRLDGSTLQRLAAADSTIVSQMQPAATTTTGTGAAISTDAEATTGTGLSQAPRRRQLPWLNALINEGLGSGNVTFPLGSVGSGLAVAGQGGGADGSGAAALAALLRALGGTGGEGSETSGAVSRTSSPLGTLGQGILLERLAQPDAPRASQQRVGLVGQGGDNILGVSPAPAAEVLPMDGLSANATQRGQALAAAADVVRAWAEGMARDSGNVTGLGSQALGTGSTGFSIGGTAAWSNDGTLLGGLAGMPLGALLQQRSGDLSSSGADAGAPGSTASAAAASLMDPLGVLQRLMVQSAPANPSRNTELPGSGAFLEGLLSNAPLAAVVSSSGGVRNAAGSSEGSPAGTLLGSGLGIARLSGLAGAGLQPPVGGVDGLVPWTDVLTEAAQSNRTDARWLVLCRCWQSPLCLQLAAASTCSALGNLMGSGSTAAWCVPAELEAAGSDNVADVPGGTGVETGSRISSAIANAAAVLGGSTQGGSSGGGARAAGEQQQWRATPLLERAVQARCEATLMMRQPRASAEQSSNTPLAGSDGGGSSGVVPGSPSVSSATGGSSQAGSGDSSSAPSLSDTSLCSCAFQGIASRECGLAVAATCATATSSLPAAAASFKLPSVEDLAQAAAIASEAALDKDKDLDTASTGLKTSSLATSIDGASSMSLASASCAVQPLLFQGQAGVASALGSSSSSSSSSGSDTSRFPTADAATVGLPALSALYGGLQGLCFPGLVSAPSFCACQQDPFGSTCALSLTSLCAVGDPLCSAVTLASLSPSGSSSTWANRMLQAYFRDACNAAGGGLVEPTLLSASGPGSSSGNGSSSAVPGVIARLMLRGVTASPLTLQDGQLMVPVQAALAQACGTPLAAVQLYSVIDVPNEAKASLLNTVQAPIALSASSTGSVGSVISSRGAKGSQGTRRMTQATAAATAAADAANRTSDSSALVTLFLQARAPLAAEAALQAAQRTGRLARDLQTLGTTTGAPYAAYTPPYWSLATETILNPSYVGPWAADSFGTGVDAAGARSAARMFMNGSASNASGNANVGNSTQSGMSALEVIFGALAAGAANRPPGGGAPPVLSRAAPAASVDHSNSGNGSVTGSGSAPGSSPGLAAGQGTRDAGSISGSGGSSSSTRLWPVVLGAVLGGVLLLALAAVAFIRMRRGAAFRMSAAVHDVPVEDGPHGGYAAANASGSIQSMSRPGPSHSGMHADVASWQDSPRAISMQGASAQAGHTPGGSPAGTGRTAYPGQVAHTLQGQALAVQQGQQQQQRWLQGRQQPNTSGSRGNNRRSREGPEPSMYHPASIAMHTAVVDMPAVGVPAGTMREQ